jgi:hypothetical protein
MVPILVTAAEELCRGGGLRKRKIGESGVGFRFRYHVRGLTGLNKLDRIKSQPIHMDTRIDTQKYSIKNNMFGYVSNAYPTCIRIQSARDTRYAGYGT